jgi:hypothetical protein
MNKTQQKEVAAHKIWHGSIVEGRRPAQAISVGNSLVSRTKTADPLRPLIERDSIKYASIIPYTSVEILSVGSIAMLPMRTIGEFDSVLLTK